MAQLYIFCILIGNTCNGTTHQAIACGRNVTDYYSFHRTNQRTMSLSVTNKYRGQCIEHGDIINHYLLHCSSIDHFQCNARIVCIIGCYTRYSILFIIKIIILFRALYNTVGYGNILESTSGSCSQFYSITITGNNTIGNGNIFTRAFFVVALQAYRIINTIDYTIGYGNISPIEIYSIIIKIAGRTNCNPSYLYMVTIADTQSPIRGIDQAYITNIYL